MRSPAVSVSPEDLANSNIFCVSSAPDDKYSSLVSPYPNQNS
ncbi:hypothetical protein [Scytonema millei]|nr:hypothetical protein [Scytonema millei]